MKTFLITLAAAIFSAAAFGGEAQVISIPGAPLTITSYSAEYQTDGNRQPEGILHEVRVRNEGQQEVVAYGIGFFAFDAFNDIMGPPLRVIAMNSVAVGGIYNNRTIQRVSLPYSFKKYGTGVSYVATVRLSDGTVWDADMKYVLQELQKIESDLSSEDLEPN